MKSADEINRSLLKIDQLKKETNRVILQTADTVLLLILSIGHIMVCWGLLNTVLGISRLYILC